MSTANTAKGSGRAPAHTPPQLRLLGTHHRCRWAGEADPGGRCVPLTAGGHRTGGQLGVQGPRPADRVDLQVGAETRGWSPRASV